MFASLSSPKCRQAMGDMAGMPLCPLHALSGHCPDPSRGKAPGPCSEPDTPDIKAVSPRSTHPHHAALCTLMQLRQDRSSG